MKYWYLVSSLPGLRLGEKPLMGVDGFRTAFAEHLSDNEIAVVEDVLENREPKAGGTPAIRWWNDEVQLRDAIVRVRAKNLGTDATPFLKPHEGYSVTLIKQVADAFARSNPLEQELTLDEIRWAMADEIALTDPFGFPDVLSFAIKMRIATRWASMDEETGRIEIERLIEDALIEKK